MGTTDTAKPRCAFSKGQKVIIPSGEARFVCWYNEDGTRIGVGKVPEQRGDLEFLASRDLKPSPLPVPPVALPQSDRKVHDGAFDYQVTGVRWLDAVKAGLLADEPGLGKTFQACGAADARVIVVCPAAMRVEWQREFTKWRPEFTSYIVTGTKPLDPGLLWQYDVIIVNYDILSAHVEAITAVPVTTLIVDEAHNVKTLKAFGKTAKLSGSKRSIAVAQIAAHATEKRFFLTGTPLENRPIELWPILYMINPQRFWNYALYGQFFCDGKLAEVGRRGQRVKTWDFSGASNTPKLHRLLSQMMLRRKKEILNLPPKRRQTIYVPLDDKTGREYASALRDFVAWTEENGGPIAVIKHLASPAVTKLTALRKLAAIGKIDAAIEWIVAHAEGTGRPLVVMAHHRDVTVGLSDKLREIEFRTPSGPRKFRVGQIIGGMSEKERTSDKDSFQRGEIDVIVCSIQAAGVGLTLTRASDTLFVERAWKPALLVQAEDRIYRIGQKNSCTITYLDAAGTVDEWLQILLKDKQSTVSGVVDGLDLTDEQAEAFVLGKVLGVKGNVEDFATGQIAFTV